MIKVKVIACEVFKFLCEDNGYDYTFLEISQHNHPELLNKKIQEEINKSQAYDLILLGYGLCGNAVCGLYSEHVPLYVFRAHDCSAVLLGSNDLQLNERWTCCSLYESKSEVYELDSLEDYIEKYGEHGEYLWNILYRNHYVYIDFEMSKDKTYQSEILETGRELTIKKGCRSVVEAMMNRKEHEMILQVDKREVIACSFDENILKIRRDITEK